MATTGRDPSSRLELAIALLAIAAVLGWAAVPATIRHLAKSEPALYRHTPLPEIVAVGDVAYRIEGDWKGWGAGFVAVLEDGRPLQRAPRRAVRRQGAGRFHVDESSVLFAASDNSDPRSNSRLYRLRRPRDLDPGLARAGAVGFAAVNSLLLLVLVLRLGLSLKRVSTRRALLAATAAFAAFLVCLQGLDRLLPPAPTDLLGEKLLQHRAVASEIDTVFLGSSRVYRHLDPAAFDRAFAEHGLEASSFNLGAPGMRLLEALYLAERLAHRSAPPLRRLIVETESDPLAVEEENLLSSRVIRWHDGRSFRRIAAGLHRRHDSLAVELTALARHLQPLGRRITHIGHGLELIAATVESTVEPGPRYISPQRRGFFPLDENLEQPFDAEQERELREVYSRLHDRLPAWRRTIERLRRRPATGRATDRFELELLESLQRLADEHGIELVLVLSPRPNRRPNWVYAYESGTVRRLVRFDDPDAHPDLYDPAHRFDRHHLNGAWASEMTRRLAEVLAEIESSAR